MTRPKKTLSQNFLTSKHIAKRVADAIALDPKSTVLEIGPGKGILTEILLSKVSRVVAVEKDKNLASLLKEKFQKEISEERFILLEGDVLDKTIQKNIEKHLGRGYSLVANIPYSITGKILRTFLSLQYPPENMSLLVQKEVAERVTAKHQQESLLSISVKAYGTPKYAHTVKAGSFFPKPKVDSAILSISNISKDFFEGISEKKFFEIVSAGFAHKRKLVKSNLKNYFPDEKLHLDHIPDKARAQELTLADWKNILKQ